MEKGRLTVLETDMRRQQKKIEAVYREIGQRKKGYTKDRVVLESLAFQLHNLYCAFEDLFRIVANHFENHITEPTAWHKELLDRMQTEIQGVRPPLISETAYEFLDELRGFRHVFRHAYGVKLEPAKIKIVLKKTIALQKIYEKEIANFLKKLQPKKKR
jgi:uncharacterized protein YutE (UPF0331/DUF86 family)